MSLVAMGCGLATLMVLTMLLVRRADTTLKQVKVQATLTATLPRLLLIETNLLNAETGQRGFLLTGRLDYLDPYRDAVAQLPALQDSLVTNAIPDERLHVKMVRLAELSRLKLAELAETVRLQNRGDHAAAMAIVLGDSGKAYMDETRALVDGTTAQLGDERDRLGAAIADGAASSRQLLVLVVALLILAAAFMASQMLRSIRIQGALVRQLDDEAMHDPLTRLPNRRCLDLWLAKCIAMASRGEHELALIALDLDGFKRVNDIDGHEAGDLFLVHVATALKETLRESDFLCRTGGDEFTVVASVETSEDALGKLAARLIASVEGAAGLSNGAGAAVTVSAGIAIYPADGTSAGNLMKAADLALYSAKSLGRQQARFYNSPAAIDSDISIVTE